jgi:hypothetical protein
MRSKAPFQVISQPGGIFVVSCNGGNTVAIVTMSESKARSAARRMNKAAA